MDPATIAGIVINLLEGSLKAAKNAGLLGDPDWIKYAEAGLFVAQRANGIIADLKSDPTQYDLMTAADIKEILTPATWDEIEARAKEV